MIAVFLTSSAVSAEKPADGFGYDLAAVQAQKNYCQIIVTRNGTMTPNVGATGLSSRNAGGLSGAAEVTASNASFALVAEAPAGFAIGPAGASQDVVFAAAISGSGSTSFLEMPGNTPVRLKRGVTVVEAQLTATRLSGALPAGHYRADMVLRCE